MTQVSPLSQQSHHPRLEPRPLDEAVYLRAQSEGLSELQARLLASRLPGYTGELAPLVSPSLRYLVHPEKLADGRRAAERIAQAVAEGESIGILTDYDVDGITSHVVIRRTLVELFGVPEHKLHSLIGHRIHDGYGISLPLVDRTLSLKPLPTLVITADCGSSDEPRIARLKAAGIDVVVSDHHALPLEGPPPSAYACVNPTRSDCAYPDKTIAGCMVAWLLMSLARSVLVEWGALPEATPKLSPWLSYVALGTVADCVSLGGSPANRAVVSHGLTLINRMDAACWRAMAARLGADSVPFNAETLAFQMGPRINARSRLDDPYAALHFMLAESDGVANRQLEVLDQDNQSRKAIEADMAEEARALAAPALEANEPAVVVLLEDGHPGVQGIVASRLVQAYGRPAVVLTRAAAPNMLTGSGRSIEGLHLRDALQRTFELAPEALPRFGGHSGAAGVGVPREQLDTFKTAFLQAVSEQLGDTPLYPRLWTDGELSTAQLSLATLEEIETLGPYGREFDPPLFEGRFIVEALRPVGAEGSHLMMELSMGAVTRKAIWFRALTPGELPSFGVGDTLHCAYKLNRNRWRGRESLQLMVEHASPV
ncbi:MULTISPECIES: DHHA1 domain-containing protein [Halomonadaceae]|uniref:single-stranded-DNA-specific exonuclease RecJ n=1 Tax=Halomonadaceae TaxID=28256 RepID=UPI001C6268BD|nr:MULTISPECIES: DHHA1 domain-containing protein [Halomonas]MCG7589893.1 DHHA1 domain-containing protein [Halomonas sp. McD50-5]MCG7611988.1 DHHA1 domain-containing protein [Halomonas sp. MM17-29]MCG7616058.1 DHHA1 domain-containing protein [Halomonas sp. McD50-4]MCG7618869.1 DHHA1 domain-containing protein [Halomonas sp. DSH1-27]